MIYAICAAGLWLLGFLVLPVGRWRRLKRGNGRNWPGVFFVDPDAPCPAAVWAQELYEARRKWRSLPWALPLMVVGRIVPRLAAWERDLELMGKEIEVQAERRLSALDADGERLARLREARSLVQHYRAFRGWGIDRVLVAMLDRRGDARRWVEADWDAIQRAHEESQL